MHFIQAQSRNSRSNETDGMMSLMVEGTKFLKSVDFTTLEKLHNSHGEKELCLKPKSDLISVSSVRQFAETVFYAVPDLTEKHRGSFGQDLK